MTSAYMTIIHCKKLILLEKSALFFFPSEASSNLRAYPAGHSLTLYV